MVNKSYNQLRKEAIEFVRGLQLKSDQHWDKLDKFGYENFPKTEDEDPFYFTFKGMGWSDNHDDSDVFGAIQALQIIFNLNGDEIFGYETTDKCDNLCKE
jgi:hypothetical protein